MGVLGRSHGWRIPGVDAQYGNREQSRDVTFYESEAPVMSDNGAVVRSKLQQPLSHNNQNTVSNTPIPNNTNNLRLLDTRQCPPDTLGSTGL